MYFPPKNKQSRKYKKMQSHVRWEMVSHVRWEISPMFGGKSVPCSVGNGFVRAVKIKQLQSPLIRNNKKYKRNTGFVLSLRDFF